MLNKKVRKRKHTTGDVQDFTSRLVFKWQVKEMAQRDKGNTNGNIEPNPVYSGELPITSGKNTQSQIGQPVGYNPQFKRPFGKKKHLHSHHPVYHGGNSQGLGNFYKGRYGGHYGHPSGPNVYSQGEVMIIGQIRAEGQMLSTMAPK